MMMTDSPTWHFATFLALVVDAASGRAGKANNSSQVATMSSWVEGADGSEFPIQNLPMGVFSHASSGRDPRIGVAIGSMVVDMRQLYEEGILDEYAHAAVFGESTLNDFMARPRAEWQAVRAKLTALLSKGSDDALTSQPKVLARCLVRRSEVRMHLPAKIGDYTDFYSSREHATNVGTMFRGKDNALQPNWLHLPVGYHGRASSVVLSGTDVVRPCGQIQLDKTDPTKGTEHIPCRLFDFELEMGFFVGGEVRASATPHPRGPGGLSLVASSRRAPSCRLLSLAPRAASLRFDGCVGC
jgi:fumarylacetoacetase